MAAGTKVQLRLGDRVIAEVAFSGDELRIGRMKENDLVINNLAVSRFHAVLRRVGEAIEVEDLSSENGTFVDGIAVKGRAVVPAGAELTIGKHVLEIRARGEGSTQPPRVGRSDVWDAAQTYFAPELAPRMPAAEEAEAPVELEAEVMAAETADEIAEAAEPLPPLDAQPEPPARRPAAALDLPDPDGLFAFGDDDLAAPPAVDMTQRAREYDVATPEASAPLSGSETALFDFGGEADLAASDPALARPAAPPAPSPATAAPIAPAPLHAGLIVSRAGRVERVVALRGEELVIGRGPRCDLSLTAAGVSRRHARVVHEGEGFRVVDLGSANGFAVNGERMTDRRLALGDVIQIEDYTLTFVLDHAPLDEAVAPVPTAAASAALAGHMTVLRDAPYASMPERDLVTAELEDEAPVDAEKELEMVAELSTPSLRSAAVEAATGWVVELALAEEALPPALREALRGVAGEELRLSAEVRLRRKA